MVIIIVITIIMIMIIITIRPGLHLRLLDQDGQVDHLDLRQHLPLALVVPGHLVFA